MPRDILSAGTSPETAVRHCEIGGVDVPVVGQGTWNLERAPREQAVQALRVGLDLGMTHVDTAEMYGDGRVEDMVGEAIDGRRDELYLVSKVLPRDASREGTLRACAASLERLRTEWLDLYLLHWPGRHPLEETIAAFEQLVREGAIHGWGVSNFAVADLERALRIAGPGRIACNQVLYHMQERAIEHEVLPWCREHGVAVVAYSPFCSGSFPGPRTEGGKALAEIAAARRATPHQVALAYVLRHESVLAIPKAARIEHVRENAAAGDLALGHADIAALDAAFPLGRRPRELPMI